MIEGKGAWSASGAVPRQPPFPPDRYISRTKLRDALDISDRQLQRMERREDWPDGYLIGSRIKYWGADILAWLDAQRV